MTEKACWQQFLTTGKVEDYLQFKAVSENRESKAGTKAEIKEEDFHAGTGKSNRDRSG